MADFKLDGRMKVKSLKDTFKKTFGATLRVYKSVAKAHLQMTMQHSLQSVPKVQKVVKSSWVATSKLVILKRKLQNFMVLVFKSQILQTQH